MRRITYSSRVRKKRRKAFQYTTSPYPLTESEQKHNAEEKERKIADKGKNFMENIMIQNNKRFDGKTLTDENKGGAQCQQQLSLLSLELISSSHSAESGLDALLASLEKIKEQQVAGWGLRLLQSRSGGLADAAKKH